MRYKNTKTGYIIDVNSEIRSKLWEMIDTPATPAPNKAEEKPKAIKNDKEPVKETSKKKTPTKKAVKK